MPEFAEYCGVPHSAHTRGAVLPHDRACSPGIKESGMLMSTAEMNCRLMTSRISRLMCYRVAAQQLAEADPAGWALIAACLACRRAVE
jgi:hypothetical protein